jgi:hypothetical protein
VILGAFATFVVVNSSSAPRKIDVTFELALRTQFTCAEIPNSPYRDYLDRPAEIYDNSENLLGSGQMDTGVDFDGECLLTAEFEIDVSKDGAYRAAAGNPTIRGLINFLEEDVVEDRLLIDLWCCTEYSDGGADIPACNGKENGGDSLGGSAGSC